MLQTEDTITCTHSVSVVQCGLYFSDRDKPKHVDFRDCLRNVFPVERRRPEKARRGKVEGFRPRRAYFRKTSQHLSGKKAVPFTCNRKGQSTKTISCKPWRQ